MLQHPVFKPHLRVVVAEGEGVLVLSEPYQTVLQGRLYEAVAPGLDGCSVEAVCSRLAPQLSPAEVLYTLQKLEQNGYLCEAHDAVRRDDACWWATAAIDPVAAAARLSQTSVAVEAVGLDAQPLRALLQSMHVRLSEDGAALRVVLTDSYLRKRLRHYNREALRSGQPWLLVKPVGSVVWVGPLLWPGKTGCWQCLARRLAMNNPLLGYADGVGDQDACEAVGRARTPASLSVAWGLAAQAVATWIARDRKMPLLEGKIQTFDLCAWKTRSHTLVQNPACPACGSQPAVDTRGMRPLALESRPKAFTQDGGHRWLSPQETLDKYGHHVSPICGAVSRLERSSAATDGAMHVYFSGRNVARLPKNLAGLKTGLRNTTCGKGTSDLQAKASALCEGLERYCGIFRGDEPRRAARMAELGEAAIHPNACLLFSPRQYQDREARNCRAGIFNYIPREFGPQAQIEWSPVWSLTRETTRYLPTAFCYYSYPSRPDQDYCRGCSNGNAAGNCLEEAILQGFLELVERDSVALWWYNRLRMPAVDLDSFQEPHLGRLASFLKTQQRDLRALDLTSDLDIPVFAAISRRTGGASEQIMFGFGAHLDPRIALLRAVTELSQMLVHLLQVPVDELSKHFSEKDTLQWLQTARLADHPYLLPCNGPARRHDDYPRCWSDDLKDDILLCKSRIEALGLEMLVLDQTRAEIGMPVVKVIVPGLRHFWARFAPGRLYDVPVKLGWLAQPRTEEELNPVPMFL